MRLHSLVSATVLRAINECAEALYRELSEFMFTVCATSLLRCEHAPRKLPPGPFFIGLQCDNQ